MEDQEAAPCAAVEAEIGVAVEVHHAAEEASAIGVAEVVAGADLVEVGSVQEEAVEDVGETRILQDRAVASEGEGHSKMYWYDVAWHGRSDITVKPLEVPGSTDLEAR